jgi:CRISPR-associated protein Csy3
MSILKIPNMLSYARSINPTDGLMMGIQEDGGQKEIVEVRERGARSPFSNHKEVSNAEKNPARGNPKTGDIAFLSSSSDTLLVTYHVTFSGKSLEPHSCNAKFADTRNALSELTAAFAEKGGYKVLAERYLGQILNGSTAWRNNDLTDESFVEVDCRFGAVTATNHPTGQTLSDKKSYTSILDAVSTALSTPKGFLRIKVSMRLTMAPMTEVYPSQSFTDNAKGRLLASVPVEGPNGRVNQAIIHNQKIGNAIRCIDDWYEENAPYPIAIEPFGIDRSLDRAIRIENNRHFYRLLTHELLGFLETVNEAKTPKDIPGDVYYFIGCLIRGGVFSGKDV